MPSIEFDDEDLKKIIQEKAGLECNSIVSKKINEDGSIEIFWRC